MRAAGVVVAGVLAVLTACGSESTGDGGNQACTLIGTGNTLGVTVEADVAPVRALALRVCVDDRCREREVALMEGSTTIDQGCDGDSCVATASPDGTQFGVEFMRFVEGPYEVSGSYRVDGRTVSLAPTTLTATRFHPNGRECDDGGVNLDVTIGAAGIS